MLSTEQLNKDRASISQKVTNIDYVNTGSTMLLLQQRDSAGPTSGKNSGLPTILFNISKKEVFTPSNGMKSLQRRLRNQFKIGLYKEEMNLAKLADTSLIIFGAPREKFSSNEFFVLKQYLERGGSILYLASEGGESQQNTNFNYLLEEYGIMVNSDALTRTVYYKYYHPKEVYVPNGILNREINRAAGKKISLSATTAMIGHNEDTSISDMGKFNSSTLTFLFPFGATLNVQKPAIPILSSGTVSYPLNRPVGAVYLSPHGKGKIVVLGSASMFSDNYIDKEENGKLFDVLIQFLTSENIILNSIDANEPDVSDYHYLPDTQNLAENVRCCLQESEELPKDFTTLFDLGLFKFDTSLIPDAIKLYTQLQLKHETLALIQPQFETPLPQLQPATFPPTLRDLPPPALDLFDLDEQFASERVRLAQLTNKCYDDDLEFYIREAAEILGVTSKLSEENRTAKHMLDSSWLAVRPKFPRTENQILLSNHISSFNWNDLIRKSNVICEDFAESVQFRRALPVPSARNVLPRPLCPLDCRTCRWCGIITIPNETLYSICSYLRPKEILKLGLTCKALAKSTVPTCEIGAIVIPNVSFRQAMVSGFMDVAVNMAIRIWKENKEKLAAALMDTIIYSVSPGKWNPRYQCYCKSVTPLPIQKILHTLDEMKIEKTPDNLKWILEYFLTLDLTEISQQFLLLETYIPDDINLSHFDLSSFLLRDLTDATPLEMQTFLYVLRFFAYRRAPCTLTKSKYPLFFKSLLNFLGGDTYLEYMNADMILELKTDEGKVYVSSLNYEKRKKTVRILLGTSERLPLVY
ncbi:Intraflagellar transport protein 52 [Nowakowskiella sp. JEL0407]|nr:Intraflagellar transport protein 52 [Nowakowskiella sp. JEL0407]